MESSRGAHIAGISAHTMSSTKEVQIRKRVIPW